MNVSANVITELVEKELQSRIKPHWTKARIRSMRYIIKHKMLGFCRYCANKLSSPRKSSCDYHINIRRQSIAILKKENRCRACGIELLPEKEEVYRCSSCKEQHALYQRSY